MLIIPLLFACQNEENIKDPDLHSLVTFMLGTFSNLEQSNENKDFEYLQITNTRIWKNQPGYWIYWEMSDVKKEKIIKRQRIMQLERLDDKQFIGSFYNIPNAEKYIEASTDPEVFEDLAISDLNHRSGCDVYFVKKTSTIFSGKTKYKECGTSLDFIDYIKTDFVVSREKVSIWVRGYNKQGKQVLGKIDGPYLYDRMSSAKL